ncbi:LysR family transcriptional regulator [Roseococcus sp. YIM B11640]|uniref:LysR family transcriptional regulator n=1 Tax=Roseococcus sp. YIM B11640 TaxID=3133973 RepID=UPI003C7BE3B3
MDLRQLQIFRRIVEEGSFSRAAAALGITQPALSRQVRALEEELGMPLLYRHGRGVVPTVEGQRFAASLGPVLEELARIRDEAMSARGVARGRLRLAMPPSVAAAMAPPLWRHLRAHMPEVELHLMDGFTGTLHEWLARGEVDIAVLNTSRSSPTVQTEPFFDAHLFLIHRPGDPQVLPLLTPEGEITLSDAAKLPLLLPGRHHGARREIEAALTVSGLAAPHVEDVDSLAGLMSLIAEGFGSTLLARDAVAAEVGAGLLAAAKVREPVLLHRFVLATSSERPVTPAARAVIRFLQEEAGRRITAGSLAGSL